MGIVYNPHGNHGEMENKEEDFCHYCNRLVGVWKVFEREGKWYKRCPAGHIARAKKPKVNRTNQK